MTEYELKNDKLTVLCVTKGGALSSIKNADGVEYLWQGNPEFWSSQAPVLFPICGSIRGDKAVLKDGRAVAMGRHGIVRKRDFQLVESGSDFLTFELESDEETRKQFPFAFRFRTTYSILQNQLKVTFTVENTDKTELPFTVGGHPAFNCPLHSGEEFSDYEIAFEKEEHCTVPTQLTETGLVDMQKRRMMLNHTKTLPLDFKMFEQDAITFDQLRSRKLQLVNPKTGHGVQLNFEEFPYLILWTTANHGPFLAMEPWAGISTCSDEDDTFEKKRHMMLVKPGDTKSLSFTITIL